jgi:predicted lipid-binding transport protein (Tim44 family)
MPYGRVTQPQSIATMRRTSAVLAAIAVLALALTPGLADARAGSGGSFGSRGSNTWSAPPSTNTAPGGGQMMQRSVTPNTPYNNSPGFNSRGFNSPGFGGQGFGGRSPFMSGLMGGLIGAGIGGLLFGHGFLGGGGLGFGGFLGFLLQIFLIVMVVRFLLRWFRNRSPVTAGGPGLFARSGFPGGAGGGMPAAGPAGQPIAISPADYQAYEQLLVAVQAAWTAHDLPALQRIATPEMVSVFAEQLAEQTSRGVRNSVSDVRLVQGDLAEAWQESGRQYATVAMRFSMIDVTFDAGGRVVDGSPTEHVTATELWTFLRVPGGQWVLSAIQQAR